MNSNQYYPGMEFDIPKEDKTPNKSVNKVGNILSYTQEVKDEDEVLIKFEASWCMPCKAMASIVEDFASKHPKIKVLAVDIDGEGFDELLTEYKVSSLPMFIYLKSGKVAATAYGTNSKSELHTLVTDV